MGLDWHARKRNTPEEQKAYIEKYYAEELAEGKYTMEELLKDDIGAFGGMCALVKAPKMAEWEGAVEFIKRELEAVSENIKTELTKPEERRNQRFIDYWLNMTHESYMELNGDKYVCDACPLLKDLQGADQQDSMFVGVTCSSCDFRGKIIARMDGIPDDIEAEAYELHEGGQMLRFADMLAKALEDMRAAGEFEKVPYAEYVEEWEGTPAIFRDPKKTEAEWEASMHWKERSLLDAIHWVRTIHKFGGLMDTSY